MARRVTGFFEPLYVALRNHAVGVHTVGPPVTATALGRVAARLGQPVPPAYADFLRSFDGVSLFHDLIVLYGTADAALDWAAPEQLRIGQTPEGALWLGPDGALRLVDEQEPDPIVAGSNLEAWLTATLARERVLLDREGEFREVFDEEGAISEAARWKRVRLGRRHDPAAALYLLEEAELLLEARQDEEAVARLAEAVTLDPGAGAAWQLLGVLHRRAGRAEEAEAASLRAAQATPDASLRASRLLEAALVAPPPRCDEHARAARAADPGHGARLLQEAKKVVGEGRMEEAVVLWQRLELLARAGEDLTDDLHALRRALRGRQALRVVG
ncbi:MAG: hypothetical protein RMK29_14910 [Myxococcales bacterium]|nr:SMI1/KNR4 family protein [Myxococcota bacterium]MDW8283004.1 hypothetical protein [Myxococcales bacterium]